MLRTLITIAFSALLAAPAFAAQENNFEMTPLIGYRFGGDFDVTNNSKTSNLKLIDEVSYGLLTAWKYDKFRQGEFLISHYQTNFSQHSDFIPSNDELGITYAHLGGNVAISQGLVPMYVTGGLGLTYLSPQDSQLDSETRFSMNIGLMTKLPITDNVNFQLSGRVYGTFFNSDSSIFCDQNNCLISISSDIWVQSEVNAGISIAF
ncbi:outer membrane beta-barrel protein [Colwellia asteriadis]|uniref:Outer membrane beta-barrel protein n=1 Tax=Colwellia asteriadis TaxID=517723 RepID=A0ABN1L2Z9_9GAMM